MSVPERRQYGAYPELSAGRGGSSRGITRCAKSAFPGFICVREFPMATRSKLGKFKWKHALETPVPTLSVLVRSPGQAIDARVIVGRAVLLRPIFSARQAHRGGQLAPLPRRNPVDCAHATVGDHAPQDCRDRNRSPRSGRAGPPLRISRRLSRANGRTAVGFGRI